MYSSMINVNWPDPIQNQGFSRRLGMDFDHKKRTKVVPTAQNPAISNTNHHYKSNVQAPLPRKVMANMANLIQLKSFQPN